MISFIRSAFEISHDKDYELIWKWPDITHDKLIRALNKVRGILNKMHYSLPIMSGNFNGDYAFYSTNITNTETIRSLRDYKILTISPELRKADYENIILHCECPEKLELLVQGNVELMKTRYSLLYGKEQKKNYGNFLIDKNRNRYPIHKSISGEELVIFDSDELSLIDEINGLKNLGYSDIEITWDSFESGPPENEAFAAGAEDIGLIGDVPLLVAKASGQKTVTFAKLSAGETTVALTLPEDSDITEPSQLKGKKIAYVKGSYGQHFLGLVLEKAGLTFDDIEEINLPNADIGNTVSSKQADAGIIWEPGLTATLSTGKIKVLLDGTGIKSNNVFFFATEEFAEKNPDALAAYIKAVERANEEIKNDPEAAAKELEGEINLPTETLAQLLTKYDFTTNISDSDIEELKDVENFNRDQGFAANEVDVDAFVDRQYLKAAGVIE